MKPKPPSPLRRYRLASPVGELTLGFSARGLARVWLPGEAPGRKRRPPLAEKEGRAGRLARAALARFFAGRAVAAGTEPPYDLARGTPFQRRVWRALRRIPRGEVVSYAGLARMIGRPGAARAVGGACGRNPLPLLFPCHRVVAADGLGGFGGAGAGLALKRRLLRREGRSDLARLD